MHFENCYNNPDFIRYCKSIAGDDHLDLMNDTAEQILKMNPEKLQHAIDKGYLLQLFKRIASNRWHHTGGQLHGRAYSTLKIDTNIEPQSIELPSNEYDTTKDVILQKVTQDMNHPQRFVPSKMLIYSQKYGSIKAYSRACKIPYDTVFRIVNDYKKYLRTWLKSH